MSLRIIESDQAGNIVATYIQSASPGDKEARIDLILPQSQKSVWKKCIDVFLPTGYPHSVTKDYLEYQIYDSLQAFSSSIAGLLASRAVLEGVGVGDASASPTAALLLTILQESMGRIATILFAHRLGTALEPECKMFRLLADIFNDIAMILDCLSPAFPKGIRVLILGGSSVLRALCGVAAGSSKASLSAHFARSNNLAELNAKDSSQETIISLLGMAAGGVVVSYITSPFATWSVLIMLLSIHLAMNHAAVRAVTMRTLNRQRATIVFSHYMAYKSVLGPEDVSMKERIFAGSGVVRDSEERILGCCKIASLTELLSNIGNASVGTKTRRVEKTILPDLLSRFEKEKFVLHVLDRPTKLALIVLKAHSNTSSQLKAWYSAMLAMHTTEDCKAFDPNWGETLNEAWGQLEQKLLDAGWDLNTTALETRPISRIVL